jgi:polar amino acid transport system permease protein
VRWIGTIYVLAVQGTPLLAWLFVFFFGLSILGIEVSPWIAAAASYSIYAGAFLGEIWRGALQAIPRTQWEAGSSLGLSLAQQLRYIIVPQATRLAIPPTVGFLVQLIKNTSLAAVIGFVELTREGQLTTGDHLPPLHRLSHRGRALLPALLPADPGEPPARTEDAAWRSLTFRTS